MPSTPEGPYCTFVASSESSVAIQVEESHVLKHHFFLIAEGCVFFKLSLAEAKLFSDYRKQDVESEDQA
jgi:hypothetical protein